MSFVVPYTALSYGRDNSINYTANYIRFLQTDDSGFLMYIFLLSYVLPHNIHHSGGKKLSWGQKRPKIISQKNNIIIIFKKHDLKK